MTGLAEFLAARLGEDEERAKRVQAALDAGWNYFDETPTELIDPARALREVAAKRAILALWKEAHKNARQLRSDADLAPTDLSRSDYVDSGRAVALEEAVRHLAAVYSGHPDYGPAWAPP